MPFPLRSFLFNLISRTIYIQVSEETIARRCLSAGVNYRKLRETRKGEDELLKISCNISTGMSGITKFNATNGSSDAWYAETGQIAELDVA